MSRRSPTTVSAPPALRRAFDRYDDAFASALGIARLLPEDGYHVEDVLSHYWMDDGLRRPDDSAPTESTSKRRA